GPRKSAAQATKPAFLPGFPRGARVGARSRLESRLASKTACPTPVNPGSRQFPRHQEFRASTRQTGVSAPQNQSSVPTFTAGAQWRCGHTVRSQFPLTSLRSESRLLSPGYLSLIECRPRSRNAGPRFAGKAEVAGDREPAHPGRPTIGGLLKGRPKI